MRYSFCVRGRLFWSERASEAKEEEEEEEEGMADVFHIDDLLDFSNEDIAGPIVGGPMPSSQPQQQQLSGLTVESSEPSICCSSSLEEEVDHKQDLCVPVSVRSHAAVSRNSHITYFIVVSKFCFSF